MGINTDDRVQQRTTTPSDDQLLSTSDAASTAGVSRQTIHDWVRRGHLEAITTNGVIRVLRVDVQRLAELRRVAAASHLRLSTVRQWVQEPYDATAEVSP